MKIAIFSSIFYPEICGITDSITLLAKEWAALGHEVHFFVPRYSTKDYEVVKKPVLEPDLGKNIKIHRLWSFSYPGSPTKQSRFVMPSGIQSWKCRKEKFDVIYTQDPFGVGIEALLMSRFLKIPLVGTNHTPITEFTSYTIVPKKLADWVGLWFFSWYYNHCQFVTAPYPGLLDEMKNYGFKQPCQALSNPIDLENFNPVSGEEEKKILKEKYGLSEKVILYTGKLAVEKRIDVIIRAMMEVKKIFPEAMLAITGSGSWDKKLKGLTEELGLAKNVKFFGMVSDEQHIEIYQASDIFSIMSTAETQSLSLMKAMSSELPSIVADAHALPYYVGRENDGRGFVVPIGDVDALAEKIIFLLGNPDKRKEMGQAAAAFVKNFSARKIAEKWQEIFRENRTACQKEEINRHSPLCCHHSLGNENLFPFHSLHSTIKNDLKLSFVIPAYNEEKYIGNVLTSIQKELRASNRGAEIIVVDNASTDRTKEIAGSFPGVRVIYEPVKGTGAARQTGFLASTGDIIANIDADCLLPSGWIEKVFSHFFNNDNLVALSGPYLYYDLPKSQLVLVRIWSVIGYVIHLINQYILRKGAMSYGGNLVVQRNAMEKIGGFDKSINFYGDDTDVVRRIIKTGEAKFTFSLPMYTSGRRLTKEGILIAGTRYAINHFWVLLFKKPFTKKYKNL